MLECFVLIYCFTNLGSISRYCVLPWTVNCFHIFVLIVLFHRSHTDDFSSFSVEYKVILFLSSTSLTCLL